MDLNKVMLIGNVTQDPEVRTTPQGQNVCSFSVATNLTWTDKSGQRQQRAEFHNIVAWRKLADICAQYLQKGKKVYVEGRLQTRNWQGQDGLKRYRTEIIADNVIMLSGGGGEKNFGSSEAPKTATKTEAVPTVDLGADAKSAKPVATVAAGKDSQSETITIEDIPF